MKKYIVALTLAILTLATVALSDYFPDVIVTSPNGIWTDTRAYSSINAAVTAIGASERDLYVIRQAVTTNLTVPANISLHFYGSGSIANSGQLIINTTRIDAGDRQIFTGTGDVGFIAGSVARSSWFSTVVEAINQTNDDTLTLVVTGRGNITANCTVGDGVSLKWDSANHQLVANAGFTLSNIGQITAGDFVCFTGPGDFSFRDGTNLNLSWFMRLRSLLTYVGSDNVTVIVPGTNVVDYSDTVPLNISFDMASRKGIFNVSAGVTLTLPIPSNIIAPSTQQIFSGAGTVTFSVNGAGYPEWWGAKGDGTTDDTAAVQSACTALKEVVLQHGASYLLGAVSIPTTQGFHLQGNWATIVPKDTPTRVFLLDDDATRRLDQTIENLNFDGDATSLIDVTGGYYQNLTIRGIEVLGGTGTNVIRLDNDNASYTPDIITIEHIKVTVWNWQYAVAFSKSGSGLDYGGVTCRYIYHYSNASGAVIYSAGVVSVHRCLFEHIYGTGYVLNMGNCVHADIRNIYGEPLFDAVRVINGVYTNCLFNVIAMYWNSTTIGTDVDLLNGRFEHCNFKEISIADAANALASFETVHLLANSDHNRFEDLTDTGAADNRAWYCIEDLGYRNSFADGKNDRNNKAVIDTEVVSTTVSAVTIATLEGSTFSDGDGFKVEIIGHEIGGNAYELRIMGLVGASAFNIIAVSATDVSAFKFEIIGRYHTSGTKLTLTATGKVSVHGADYRTAATETVFSNVVTDALVNVVNALNFQYYVPTLTAGDVIYIDSTTITPIYSTGN